MTEMKAILVRTRELIADPKSWLQRNSARNSVGCTVGTRSSRAKSFCVLGALDRASWELKTDLPSKTLRAPIKNHLPPSSRVVDWNDAPRRTHAQVLRLLDKAIAATARTP